MVACKILLHGTERTAAANTCSRNGSVGWVGLYTILPLPILYGAWHTQGGVGGGSYMRNSRAKVLQ